MSKFTLFSRKKKGEIFFPFTLFEKWKWNRNDWKSRSRSESEIKMTRDREVKFQKNSREFSRIETLAGHWGLCERDPSSDLAFNISMFQVTGIVPFQPWSWNLIKRCKSSYQPNMVNKFYIKSALSWLHVSGCQGGWGSHLSPIVFQPAHKLHTHQHQRSSSTNTNCKHTQIT